MNVELTIVTNIDSEVLENGLGGPVLVINKCENNERIKFAVGLIKNDDSNGHYQFIYEHEDGPGQFIAPSEHSGHFTGIHWYMLFLPKFDYNGCSGANFSAESAHF